MLGAARRGIRRYELRVRGGLALHRDPDAEVSVADECIVVRRIVRIDGGSRPRIMFHIQKSFHIHHLFPPDVRFGQPQRSAGGALGIADPVITGVDIAIEFQFGEGIFGGFDGGMGRRLTPGFAVRADRELCGGQRTAGKEPNRRSRRYLAQVEGDAVGGRFTGAEADEPIFRVHVGGIDKVAGIIFGDFRIAAAVGQAPLAERDRSLLYIRYRQRRGPVAVTAGGLRRIHGDIGMVADHQQAIAGQAPVLALKRFGQGDRGQMHAPDRIIDFRAPLREPLAQLPDPVGAVDGKVISEVAGEIPYFALSEFMLQNRRGPVLEGGDDTGIARIGDGDFIAFDIGIIQRGAAEFYFAARHIVQFGTGAEELFAALRRFGTVQQI